MNTHNVKSVGTGYDLYAFVSEDKKNVAVSRCGAGISATIWVPLASAEELAQAILAAAADARSETAAPEPTMTWAVESVDRPSDGSTKTVTSQLPVNAAIEARDSEAARLAREEGHA